MSVKEMSAEITRAVERHSDDCAIAEVVDFRINDRRREWRCVRCGELVVTADVVVVQQ